MSAKDRLTLINQINSAITTNGNNEIDGAELRAQLIDIVDSYTNAISDGNLVGLKPYDPTKTYLAGTTCLYNNNIFLCTATTTGTFDPLKWDQQLNSSLSLGETALTAYRGDRGKTAYDHSQTDGNSHETTLAQILNLNNSTGGENIVFAGEGATVTFEEASIVFPYLSIIPETLLELFNFGGLIYDGDYSANFIENSLITKKYVDNTKLIPNVQEIATSTTVTPVFGNDLVTITTQAFALTLANPTGTWSNGKDLMIRVKDNGTPQTIAYGTKFRAIGVTLPTTTVASKTTYLGCIYNETDDRFDVIGVTTEA